MSKNMGALTYPSIGDVGSRIPIFFSSTESLSSVILKDPGVFSQNE